MKTFIAALFLLVVALVSVERIFGEPITIKQFTYEGKVIKNGMRLKDVDSIVSNIGWSKDRQDIKTGAIEDRKNNKLYLLWFKNPKRESRDNVTVENWELNLNQVIENWK